MEVSAHKDTFARDHLPPLEEWPELLLEGKRFLCTECGKCCQGSGEHSEWG